MKITVFLKIMGFFENHGIIHGIFSRDFFTGFFTGFFHGIIKNDIHAPKNDCGARVRGIITPKIHANSWTKALKLSDNDNGNDVILGLRGVFYPYHSRWRSLARGCRVCDHKNDVILGLRGLFYPYHSRWRSLARGCRVCDHKNDVILGLRGLFYPYHSRWRSLVRGCRVGSTQACVGAGLAPSGDGT